VQIKRKYYKLRKEGKLPTGVDKNEEGKTSLVQYHKRTPHYLLEYSKSCSSLILQVDYNLTNELEKYPKSDQISTIMEVTESDLNEYKNREPSVSIKLLNQESVPHKNTLLNKTSDSMSARYSKYVRNSKKCSD
jgi:hypothetical protein